MKEYTEKYTESGNIGGFLINNYFKSVNKLLLSIPKDHLNGNILEVGCGAGYSTEKILKILPRSVKLFASDFEQENVNDARKRLGSTVEVKREDIYALEREGLSFSLVFVLEVMEHLESPIKALEEVNRVSKKYAILGVPNEPLWRILNMLRGKYLKDFGNTPGHIQHWSKGKFTKLLSENGFRVLKIESPMPWTLVLVEKV